MTLTDLVSTSAVASPSLMGLTNGLSNALTSDKAAALRSTAVGSATSAPQKAEPRTQAALDASTTRVSSFGRLKSAVSEVQLASRALHSLTTTTASSGGSVTLAAGSLVTAYNNAIKAARAAVAVAGAPSESVSAKRASRELLQSVTADAATLASLAKLGITVLPDGTLALDVKPLAAAESASTASLRATLAKLADRLDNTATQELAGNTSAARSLAAYAKV